MNAKVQSTERDEIRTPSMERQSRNDGLARVNSAYDHGTKVS